MPFHGDAFITIDKYMIRSQMSPEFTMCVDTRDKNQDYDLFRKFFKEWKEVSPCYFGDYWPLTPFSLTNDVWMGWQFDRTDMGKGFFQAFRRAECPDESVTLKLRGLDERAVYVVTDLDNPTPRQVLGSELMNGFVVKSTEKPAALIFTYEKK
jgi:alpha-galactosidase